MIMVLFTVTDNGEEEEVWMKEDEDGDLNL